MMDPKVGLTLWTLIIFVFLLVVLSKFAYKPLLAAVEAREAALEKAITEAKADREAAAKLLAEQQKALAETRADVQKVMADGRAAAEALRAEMIEKVKLEGAEMLERTRREMAAEKVNAVAELRREALAIFGSRAKNGTGNELELARAETELATLATEVIALKHRRSELKNALAVLVGAPASEFAVGDNPLTLTNAPPVIPAGLPGELLERRPDIAEAERSLAAHNARIGVAKAAFYPIVRLTGLAGWESADVASLFNWSSRVWSIGPSVTVPIFQGSRNKAKLRNAEALWEEGVANYRQRVLIAFQETQNALTASRLLTDQAAAQTVAVSAAQRTATLSRTRYHAGFTSYLEVVESERTALTTERGAAQIAGQRLVAAVQLIKAIGGGWDPTQLTPLAGNQDARSRTRK